MPYARLMPDVISPVPDVRTVPLAQLVTPELLARLLAQSGQAAVPVAAFNSRI